jgi:hypothetical protein
VSIFFSLVGLLNATLLWPLVLLLYLTGVGEFILLWYPEIQFLHV